MDRNEHDMGVACEMKRIEEKMIDGDIMTP